MALFSREPGIVAVVTVVSAICMTVVDVCFLVICQGQLVARSPSAEKSMVAALSLTLSSSALHACVCVCVCVWAAVK